MADVNVMDISGLDEPGLWAEPGDNDPMDIESAKEAFQKKWSLDSSSEGKVVENGNSNEFKDVTKPLFEKICHKGIQTVIPVAALHPTVPLGDVFSLENIKSSLSQPEMDELMSLLPEDSASDRVALLKKLLDPEHNRDYFSGGHPLLKFIGQLRAGLFDSEIVQYKEVLDQLRRKQRELVLTQNRIDVVSAIVEDRKAKGLPIDPELKVLVPSLLNRFDSEKAAFEARRLSRASDRKREREDFSLSSFNQDDPDYQRKLKAHKSGEREDPNLTDSDSEFMLPEETASALRRSVQIKLLPPAIPRAPPIVRKRATRPKPEAQHADAAPTQTNLESGADAQSSTHEPTKPQSAPNTQSATEVVPTLVDPSLASATVPPLKQEEPVDGKTVPPKTSKPRTPRVPKSEDDKPRPRKRVPARRDIKNALPNLQLPPNWTLFPKIRATLGASDTDLQKVIKAIQADEALVRSIPPGYSVSDFTLLSLQFLQDPPPIPQTGDKAATRIFKFDPCVAVNPARKTFSWILPSSSPSSSLLERLEMLFYYAIARVKVDCAPIGQTINVPKEYFKKQICRVTFKEASEASIALYRKQEQERFDHESECFFFDIDGYRSIVGPLRRPLKAPKKQREHPMLIEDREFMISLVNMVINGGSRLPGGVGTRADVAQLVSYSKYVKPGFDIEKFNSVVSAALDRIQLIADAPLKFDVDLKLWVYNHRLRTPEDYRRIEEDIDKQTAALEADGAQGDGEAGDDGNDGDGDDEGEGNDS